MTVTLLQGDALEVLRTLPERSVQTCVTSPPYYGLRDYGVSGQIGLEATPELYIAKMVEVFRGVRRVLKDDGTLWLNMGDSYAGSGGAGGDYNEGGLKEGHPRYKSNFDIVKSKRDAKRWGGGNLPATGSLKPKDLIGVPWMLAFALRADGWYLRSDIIWHKPNPMPESVTDRPTKSHEYIFLLSKQPHYFYDADAIWEPQSEATNERSKYKWKRSQNGGGSEESMAGYDYDRRDDLGEMGINPNGRNKRSVWTVTTRGYPEAHFATYPPALIEPCILAGTSERGECPKCGKAWVRVMESRIIPTGGGKPTKMYDSKTMASSMNNKDSFVPGIKDVTTLGWRPQCDCVDNEDHEGPLIPVPQTVLDPFNGSGTTGEVAIKHRRNYIGIELNPAYIELTNKRLAEVQPVMVSA